MLTWACEDAGEWRQGEDFPYPALLLSILLTLSPRDWQQQAQAHGFYVGARYMSKIGVSNKINAIKINS